MNENILDFNLTYTTLAAVVHLISEPGQPFPSQFVLYLAVITGLAGATRLRRSDFVLYID